MELILEPDEVERLLRKALSEEGISVPHEAEMAIRANHRRNTLRVVFLTKKDTRGRKPSGDP